jgi:photosystem II stability/assembly factor-like uncharacterized protein
MNKFAIDQAKSRIPQHSGAMRDFAHQFRWVRRCVLSVVTAAALALPLVSLRAAREPLAVSNGQPFAAPVNISKSGGASRPVIATAPDGGVYALWWDVLDGMRFSRATISTTGALFVPPVTLPAVNGGVNRDNPASPVTLPPQNVRLEFGPEGLGHLLYQNNAGELLYSRVAQGVPLWPQTVARSVLDAESVVDGAGRLHMSYVLTRAGVLSPGIFYASQSITLGLSAPSPVYLSPYFRTATPEDTHLSTIANGAGVVLVAWSQRGEKQSQIARSTDGGRSWSAPADVVDRGADIGLATHISLARARNGDTFMIWRDASAVGCGFTQRRSTDDGATWLSPERIFPDLLDCPDSWRFAANDAGLWFIGVPERKSGADTAVVLAAWDGGRWSEPQRAELARPDGDGGERNLGCVSASLGGATLAMIGCDARGDIFVTHNALPLAALLPALRQPWAQAVAVSGEQAVGEGVSVAQSESGMFAVWNVAENGAGRAPTQMRFSVQGRNGWTPGVLILSAAGSAGADGARPGAMDSPALAAHKDRLFLVWRGGESGRPFFSQAYVREAESRDGWSAPQALPAPSDIGASPSIAVDPRNGMLYVLYAVSYNEARGAYLVTSADAGATWSAPVRVFDAEAERWVGVDQTRLTFDPVSDVLHAAFLRSGVSNAGRRMLYYTRSTDGGARWSALVEIAKGELAAPRLIATRSGLVMLAWRETRPAIEAPQTPFALWTAFSPDGGLNWSEARRPAGFETVSGEPALTAADSGQIFLGAIGMSVSADAQLLAAEWRGNSWADAERAPLGQPAGVDNSVWLLLRPDGALNAMARVGAFQPSGEIMPELRPASRQVQLAPAIPAPTFTPVPREARQAAPSTATPMPEPTQTPAPVSTAQPADTSLGGPDTQLIFGAIAAFVAIVVAMVMFTIVQRR